jgi:photosynthesis system II assembly factor YCF48-like protein/putative zinc finger protein
VPAGPAAQGSPAASQHPDANLLAAFEEKTLTAKERLRVTEHLAECAQCREQLALAFPPEAQAAQPASAAGRKPAWLAWPSVRWVPWAAALGSLLIVLTLFYHRRSQQPREVAMSQMQRPPAPAGAGSNAIAPAALPASGSSQQAERKETGKTSIENRKSKIENGTPQILSRSAQLEAAPRMRSLRKPSSLSSGLARPANEATTEAATPAPPPPAPAPADSFRSERTTPETATGVSAAPATSAGSGRVPALPGPETSAKELQAQQPSVTIVETGPAESSLDKKAPPTPPKAEGQTMTVLGAAPAPQTQALRVASRHLKKGAAAQTVSVAEEAQGKPNTLNVHWSISSGRVQRSLDAGKTWEDLHVDDAVVFRVVMTTDGDVWAGGSSGAVYHSSDGGEHWVRLTLSSSTIADAIVRIDFSDPQHGVITTAAGSRWSTMDGGRHWQRSSP